MLNLILELSSIILCDGLIFSYIFFILLSRARVYFPRQRYVFLKNILDSLPIVEEILFVVIAIKYGISIMFDILRILISLFYISHLDINYPTRQQGKSFWTVLDYKKCIRLRLQEDRYHNSTNQAQNKQQTAKK